MRRERRFSTATQNIVDIFMATSAVRHFEMVDEWERRHTNNFRFQYRLKPRSQERTFSGDRIIALDAPRGLAVMGMILIVSPGSWEFRLPILSHTI